MYEMKNLNETQFKYIHQTLRNHGVNITSITVNNNVLILSRDLEKGQADIITVINDNNQYCALDASDPNGQMTISNTVIDAILREFQKINSWRINQLYQAA